MEEDQPKFAFKQETRIIVWVNVGYAGGLILELSPISPCTGTGGKGHSGRRVP